MQPSEFYRKLRPENFSDSVENISIKYTREMADYNLSQLSTDQKEHQFERLGRHLSEKFICPNLIPATGPAGGGDGKTDTETYPVSTEISNRWFIPSDRDQDQKRAFAMSVKADWGSKLLSDIRNIVSTNRGYNRIYFITNQKISDKKKKETQDKYKIEFGIETIILDGNRILETVYNKDCLDIFINDLGYTNNLIESTKITGTRDYTRQETLKEIEKNIQDVSRYGVNDYQLGEECINAFIYSRMLELPNVEIIGKIERAKNIVSNIGNLDQQIKCHYQSAWTYMQYLGDYHLFFQEYKLFKSYVIQSHNIDDIEKRKTLLTLCFPLNGIINFSDYGFNFNEEISDIKNILDTIASDNSRPTSSLVAKTHLLFLNFQQSLFDNQEINNNIFVELLEILRQAGQYLSFPMQMFIDLINVIGELPIKSKELDVLFEEIAIVVEKRDGEIASARIFHKRGEQKLSLKEYKDAVIFFGKCVSRFAKEEAEKDLISSLALLGNSYSQLGLHRAAHTSLIASLSIAAKELIKTGNPHGIELTILKEIIYNELVGLGRVPNLLNYYLLYRGIFSKLKPNEKQIASFNEFTKELDRLLSCRLIGSNAVGKDLVYIPDIFSKLDLPMSEETALYILGYTDGLINEGIVKNIDELDDLYSKLASQPFLGQISYETNFMSGNIVFYSKVAGLEIKIDLKNNSNYVFIIETFLSYVEAFFATSIMEVLPIKDCILIEFIIDSNSPKILLLKNELNKYLLIYNPTKPLDDLANVIVDAIAPILAENFFIKDLGNYLNTVMITEELQYRIGLTANHSTFKSNFLGDIKDYSIAELIVDVSAEPYQVKRQELILNKTQFDFPEEEKKINHQNIDVVQVINNDFRNKAGRNGIGLAILPDTDIPYLMILYKDINYGINIFEELIGKMRGNIDRDEILRISFIQGIDTNNPHRYKVNIGPKLNEENLKNKGGLQVSLSRIHTMTPQNSKNINNFLEAYKIAGSYYLIPAHFDEQKGVMPIFDKTIQKREIIIRHKDEIGDNDIDIVAIREK